MSAEVTRRKGERMGRQRTKYRVRFQCGNETVRAALASAVKEEYETLRQAGEAVRAIRALFSEVSLEVQAVTRFSGVKIRKMKRY